MNAFAINGQTAATKGFSGIMYRATAFLAGFDSGTFLTESAAGIGGFIFEGTQDFDSRWTGAGSDVVHPNFAVSRMIPRTHYKRETARVLRWAKLDGEQVTMAWRDHVAKLAKGRHAESRAFVKSHGDIGAALLCFLPDSDAVSLAVSALRTSDGSAEKMAWRAAMRAANPKNANFLTI